MHIRILEPSVLARAALTGKDELVSPKERHLMDDERAIRSLIDTWMEASKAGDLRPCSA